MSKENWYRTRYIDLLSRWLFLKSHSVKLEKPQIKDSKKKNSSEKHNLRSSKAELGMVVVSVTGTTSWGTILQPLQESCIAALSLRETQLSSFGLTNTSPIAHQRTLLGDTLCETVFKWQVNITVKSSGPAKTDPLHYRRLAVSYCPKQLKGHRLRELVAKVTAQVFKLSSSTFMEFM